MLLKNVLFGLIFFFGYTLCISETYESNWEWKFEAIKYENNTEIRDTLTLKRVEEDNPDNLLSWVFSYNRTMEDKSIITVRTVQQVRVIQDRGSMTGAKVFKTYMLDLPQLDYLEKRMNQILQPIAFDYMDKGIQFTYPILKNAKEKTSVKSSEIFSRIGDLIDNNRDTTVIEKDESISAYCSYTISEIKDYKFKEKNYKCWVIENGCENSDFTNIATYYFNEELGFMYMFIRFPDYTVQIKLIDVKK
ncbi:MAG: hypothetical protein R2863_09205 [Candidatus Kapaibacterium sp.]|nr:hypothetical protein [Ignavibacteriota bacterium]MCB9221532.1 hypothetical protein [Ignavibacteria bacterium]MCB9222485.1 hypothetical protein [Ignavibacteria bacterium]